MIAFLARGWAERDIGVEVHAAIELEQNIFRRAVRARDETQVRRIGDARNGVRIRVTSRDRAGHAVRVEIRIAIRSIGTRVSERRGGWPPCKIVIGLPPPTDQRSDSSGLRQEKTK